MYPTNSTWGAMVNGGSVQTTGGMQVWRGGTLLEQALKVEGWTETITVDERKVVSQLTFTAPDPNADLASRPDAILGWAGQQVGVRAGYRVRSGDMTLPLGWWRIDTPTPDPATWVDYSSRALAGNYPGMNYPGTSYPGVGVLTNESRHRLRVRKGGQVSVSCSDLLTLLEDDLPSLTGPLPNATVQSEVIRLIAGRIPVAATWAGVNGAYVVPANMVYPDNRLAAICDLLGMPGAVAWINRAGAFQPLPASKSTVDWLVPISAVESAPVAGSLEGIYNKAIVTGSTEEGADIWVAAVGGDGLFGSRGPFGTVSKSFSDSVGKTSVALQATADKYLREGIDARAVRFVITLVTPNWTIDPLDRVSYTDPDGRTFAGPVVGITRSLAGMSMELVVPYREVWPDAL